MEGIKYVNLIEISPVVIEIRGAENGDLAVPVNNTLVSHTAFLAADTRSCVLIYFTVVICVYLIVLYLFCIKRSLSNLSSFHFQQKDSDKHGYANSWPSNDGDRNQQNNQLSGPFLL